MHRDVNFLKKLFKEPKKVGGTLTVRTQKSPENTTIKPPQTPSPECHQNKQKKISNSLTKDCHVHDLENYLTSGNTLSPTLQTHEKPA